MCIYGILTFTNTGDRKYKSVYNKRGEQPKQCEWSHMMYNKDKAKLLTINFTNLTDNKRKGKSST